MTALIVNLAAPNSVGRRKVSIVTESGIVATLPYAPQQVEHGAHGYRYDEIDRPARSPLLVRAMNTLGTMQFTATVGHPDGSWIEPFLDDLLKVIRSAERVRIGYTMLSGGLWHIVDDKIVEQDHEEGTNACIRAEVTLTLKKADQG